jgi:hypothetical protein
MPRGTRLALSGSEVKSRFNATVFAGTAVLSICLLSSAQAPARQQGSARTEPARAFTFTTFEAPGSGTGAQQGTVPFSINAAGSVAGTYYDASNAYHGFVRDATGTMTTFEAPGSGTGASQGTFPFSINTPGEITGPYVDASNAYHGFLRGAKGKIITFEVPGSGTGTHQGTVPVGINATGAVAGMYFDANNVCQHLCGSGRR